MTIRFGLRAQLLSALACLVLLAAMAAPASAGSYNVYQCHPSYGDASAPGWAAGANGFTGGVASCFNSMFGLTATGVAGGGQYMWWSTPSLPSGLKFSNLNLKVNGSVGGGSTTNAIRTCIDGLPVWNGICTTSTTLPAFDTAGQTIETNVACLYTSYTCNRYMFNVVTASGNYQGTGVLGHLGFGSMIFTVEDLVAPGALPPYSGTLKTSYNQPVGRAWNSGTRTTYVGGADAQGGIKQVESYADGDTTLEPIVTTLNSGCNYVNWQPCPSTKYDNFGSVNTNVISANSGDGPHAYTVRATDAAGNQHTNTVSFYVDNTGPSTPSNIAIAGTQQGWSATNDFDVTWANDTEELEDETHSGIDQVKVDVEPVDAGSQSNPAAVTIPVGGTVSGIAATRSSISGLTVPAAGQWRLRLSVIDKAGNESAIGDGSGGGADSDHEIGYDPTPPAAPQGQANGWISRLDLANGYDQEWDFTALPGSFAPICGFAGSISLSQIDNPGTTINIPGNVRKWRLPANLSEDNHWIHLRAVTCAGLASSATENVEAKVDLTDPTGTISGIENGRWYKDGQLVGLHGTDALSGMAPSATNEFADGAYLDYSIDGVGPDATNVPRGSDTMISISGEGSKELRLSPVDLAGNKAAAKVVNFGIDASDPTGHFTARSSSNPRLLRAPIGDSVSGIALSTIEVSKQGEGDWQLLPTSLADLSGNPVGGYPTSAVASAVFPDTSLPQGTYVARVRAYDQAGNELVTSKDENGNTFTFENPMRDGVALSAGLSKAKRTCKKKRGPKCVKRSRGKVVFTGTYPTLSVGYKRGAVAQGFLTTNTLTRLARQPIEIYARVKGGSEQLLGTTSTRTDGSYVFKIRPGVSRQIRVYYPGTNTNQDTSATVQLGTGAKLKLRVSTRHARTGQTVTFRGSVRSFDGVIPAAGKIVALQFYAGKKWRPAVAIAHTDSNGNFAVKYRFDRISKGVKARIVFRVYAPTEDGWNHAASSSRRVTLRLN
ncbi:MAG: Ig-like domain repeat protein [Actinobacteria bacterium]|nr:Ig-like domain repeat protein [Actinomycetota bacterium]